MAIAEGTVEEAELSCQILNDEPMTMPADAPIWFLWEDGNLRKVPLPCKYIPGKVM